MNFSQGSLYNDGLAERRIPEKFLFPGPSGFVAALWLLRVLRWLELQLVLLELDDGAHEVDALDAFCLGLVVQYESVS